MTPSWAYAEYVAELAVPCLIAGRISSHIVVVYGGMVSARAAERSAQLREFSGLT